MRNRARVLEEYAVMQARAGEQRGFAQLVALRGPKLLAHATRLLGHREDARDVVQDAWVEILNGLKGLREPNAFAAWSTRIVTRRCARYIGGQIKQRELGAQLWHEAQIMPEAAQNDDGQAQAIREAIGTLPAAQSATIALFYLEEMSVAEVAIALDVPIGTVKTRLMHAREKLKHALKGMTND